MGGQKSAEGIVAAAHGGEGPNMRSWKGTEFSMDEGDADRMAGMPEDPAHEADGIRGCASGERQTSTAGEETSRPGPTMTMERVVRRENMFAALKRVRSNGGAPGIDGMTVEDLPTLVRERWQRIKVELLDGDYRPSPVRRVEIPKPGGGGMRKLGIPTVLDRLIQQALLQVMGPEIDPTFSDSSFGFRPGRGCHDAVRASAGHIEAGHRWVVDVDLERFFDRVNHDVLMGRVARRVGDQRILGLIRRYLEAGIMEDGVVQASEEGTPQGGPLSPLLSNILLDDLDKELERRGHRFCRYADDSNVYVRSKAAGERVMRTLTGFLEKVLRLRVNREKSAVDRPWNRKFLGYTVTFHRKPRLKVAPKAVERFKRAVRDIMKRGRGRNIVRVIEELVLRMRGWGVYFQLARVKGTFEDLDQWIRRRLRCILWRQWKRPKTRLKRLCRLGLDRERAKKSSYNGRGPWWNAGASHMNEALPVKWFEERGLLSLLQQHQRFAHSM